MPTTSKKKKVSKKKASRKEQFISIVLKPFVAVKNKATRFMARRPHRSFQLTQRRDVVRSLQLPGYFAFTHSVNKTLWRHKKVFIWLAATYAFLTVILIGIGSQETYSTLVSTLQETGSEIFKGNIGQVGQATLLFFTISSLGLTSAPTEAQQLYIIVLGLLIWLTSVWLLRNLLAGHKVKMRDGLYNAGSPIIATFLVAFVLLVQLIPIALAAIAYSAASATGLLDGGVQAMLFWFAAALLAVLSLYWITSTFFALIIVTLPGMYPMRALRTAGDMMVGRRLRILLRILWMAITVALASGAALIPVILIDTGLIHLWPVVDTVPVVPVALMLVGVVAFIWSASYIYLLYRKVVDDDAKPA